MGFLGKCRPVKDEKLRGKRGNSLESIENELRVAAAGAAGPF